MVSEKNRNLYLNQNNISLQNDLNRPYLIYTGEKLQSGETSILEALLTQDLVNRKPFICEVCNRSFTAKSNLKRHYLIHTKEKPFTCEICNKSFTQKSHLTTHYQFHIKEKEKLHSCEICNKKFSLKSNLMRHCIVHTNDNPYICEVCNRGFNQKGSLKRHILVHKNETPLLRMCLAEKAT